MDNSWAKPGVRCVCVAQGWCAPYTGTRSIAPTGGPIFKVVSVIERYGAIWIGIWDVPDLYWRSDGFRPVVDRETPAEQDIALFAPFLHGKPEEVA